MFFEKIKIDRLDFISITVLISMAVYVILNSYVFGTYISVDTSFYLRASQSLIDGNGFYYDKTAGDAKSWFAIWPIGYPALIALISFITGANVYLSSKILSIVILFLIVLIFKMRFKENAWLYSLSIVNVPFVSIFCYTWSEQPFILGLLWFSIALYDVCRKTKVHWSSYISLSLSSIFLFSLRYIGAFSVGIIATISFIVLVNQMKNRLNKRRQIKHVIFLSIISVINSAAILLYLLNNIQKNGFATGAKREVAHESFFQLITLLGYAQLREISPFVFENNMFYIGVVAVLTIAGILIIVKYMPVIFSAVPPKQWTL